MHAGTNLLEISNLLVAQLLLPVEGGGAVVCQELARELLVDGICELACLGQVWRGRLHPQQVCNGGIGETASNGSLQSHT